MLRSSLSTEDFDIASGPRQRSPGIFTRRNIGFISQYFVVGLVYGGLPATTYGVLSVYLNTPGYIYESAKAMATLPWSFKAFYGALHDCVPIRGYRRKPYMVIGWLLCGLALLFLSATPLPEPYWCVDDDRVYVTACDGKHANHSACSHLNASSSSGGGASRAATPCNAAAANHGGSVAMLLFLACLGYVCADVAADGLTVSYAQQEPLEVRGRTQSTVYFVRSLGFIASYLLVGFGMNGKEYGGSFDFGLSFEATCALFAVPCLAMVPVSWLLVQEEPLRARPAAREYFRGVWRLMSSSFFFSIVLFSFVYTAVGGVSSPAGIGVQRYWAGVQNLQKQVFGLVSQGIFAFGLAMTKRYLLNYSWRRLLLYTMLVITLVDIFFTSCVVFDVVRNQ